MTQYKVTREINLIYVAEQRLQVGTFRFILAGPSDRVLYNTWQRIAHESGNNIMCSHSGLKHIPAGLANATVVLDDYDTLVQGLQDFYSAPGVELSVHNIRRNASHASLLWFVNGRVNGSILETDRRSLYGKSLYVSAEPVATTNEDVVHVPMDPQHDVDDRHFGDDWYSLHEGPGASIVVMQE